MLLIITETYLTQKSCITSNVPTMCLFSQMTCNIAVYSNYGVSHSDIKHGRDGKAMNQWWHYNYQIEKIFFHQFCLPYIIVTNSEFWTEYKLYLQDKGTQAFHSLVVHSNTIATLVGTFWPSERRHSNTFPLHGEDKIVSSRHITSYPLSAKHLSSIQPHQYQVWFRGDEWRQEYSKITNSDMTFHYIEWHCKG